MRIGFDFDDTLTDPRIQKLAKFLVVSGAEVWVITARSKQAVQRTEFSQLLLKIGIPMLRVIALGDNPKADIISDMEFDVFIDNKRSTAIDIACYSNAVSLHFINEV